MPHAGDFGGHANVRLSPKRNSQRVIDSTKNDAAQHCADAATHNGFKYMLAPLGVGAGDVVSSKPDAPIKPGMTLVLSSIPTGTDIHNIELRPGKGGQMCRSAGTCASLVKNEDDGYTVLRLPSGVLTTIKGSVRLRRLTFQR